METITVIIHYLKKDKQFLKHYEAITIKDEQGEIIAEYGDDYHADYENEGAWPCKRHERYE